MSAFCRNRRWRAENDSAVKVPAPSITARPTPQEKRSFAEVAARLVDRITIRLRPGDRLAIRHRAAERRMKDSAYIAALVRGHVAANPPLANHELSAFKAAVSLLAGFSRLFARTAPRSRTGRCPSAESTAGCWTHREK